jgi:hypothetical protein
VPVNDMAKDVMGGRLVMERKRKFRDGVPEKKKEGIKQQENGIMIITFSIILKD